MDRRVSLIIIGLIFIIGLCANSIAEAQSGGWKLVKKAGGEAEYVGNIRVIKNDLGTNIVNYSRVINYNPPKILTQYGAELPASHLKTHGTIDCYDNTYRESPGGLFDKNGKRVNTKYIYKLKASREPIKKASFQGGVFNLYCNPQNIAKAKQKMDQKQAVLNKQAQDQARAKKAEFDKLSKYFQPKVNQYGKVSSVQNCKDKRIPGCDYRVYTSFNIYGTLPAGVHAGLVPVFPKGNTILFKDGKIVSVKGDGKVKDVEAYYDKRWGRKK